MTLKTVSIEPVEATPCKRNPEAFSTPLLEAFDSQDFTENHPELAGDDLDRALDYAESSHEMLHSQAVKEAVDMCRSCPVLRECADWVLAFEPENGKVYGVVAGMQPHERQRLRRRIATIRRRKAEQNRASEG